MLNRNYEKTYAFGKIVADKNMMKKKMMKKEMMGDEEKDDMDEEMEEKKKTGQKHKKNKMYASQMDLEEMKAIFVSTGANLNDDVFLADELWFGRNTIAQKPVNLNHKAEKIRGHMVNAYPVTKNGEKIDASEKTIAKRGEYHWGETTESEHDKHSHSWTLVFDASGKLIEGYTSWENGHRHYISAGAAKGGKTSPGGVGGHTHELLEFSYNEDTYEGGYKPVKFENLIVASENDGTPNIPKEFDIVSESVLYKMIFPEEIDEIMTQAHAGNKFVSMETYFAGYDYLVGNKVIARNQETAFLDACLRAKGGAGNFNNEPVKRVLRNLHFGGMGIVDNPANPDSIILATATQTQTIMPDLATALANISKNCVLNRDIRNDDLKQITNVGENKDMQPTTETEVNELKQKLAEATKKLEELQGAETEKQIASLKETVEGLTTAVSKKEAELVESNKKLVAAETLATELKAKSDKLESELNNIKLAQIVAKRKLDFEKFDISEADLNEILEEVKAKNDEDYAKFLVKANRLFKVKQAPQQESTASKNDDKAAAAAEQKLETAVANKEGTLINGSGEEDAILSKARVVVDEIFGKKDQKETK